MEDKFEALAKQVYKKYGQCTLEYLSGRQWRVWIKDWHYRDGAASGPPVGRGDTALEALENLIKTSSEYTHLEHGSSFNCRECRLRECD